MYLSTLVLQHSCSCEGRPRDKPKGVLGFMVVVVLIVVDVVLFVVDVVLFVVDVVVLVLFVVDVVVVLFAVDVVVLVLFVVVTILSMEFNLARTLLLTFGFCKPHSLIPTPYPTRASNVMET